MGGVCVENQVLRRLPKMDRLLACPTLAQCGLPRPVVLQAARAELEQVRAGLRAGTLERVPALEALAQAVLRRAGALSAPRLRRVVNATGIVLHTNLGRAPLSSKALEAVIQAGAGYANLEYGLAAGARGSRTTAVEELLCALTGAPAAFVVNNNAAAVFLMLSALAAGKGVAISRGELVEIGGSFRVPDIMARSGARLMEVGTTNKTRPEDYAAALEHGAELLMKVHPSNFKVVGFTREASLAELGALARDKGALLLCDLGSGALDGRGPWPADYPTAAEAVRWADVVCFSGDKLLGGPQAGILLGRAELIDRLRHDPLARALRMDKLSLAALEATLLAWRDGDSLPVRDMLAVEPDVLRQRAEALCRRLAPLCPCTAVSVAGEAGGGALPGVDYPSWAAALTPEQGDAGALEAALRSWSTPILGRLHRGALLLDVRTLLPGDDEVLAAALAAWREGTP